MTFLFDSLAQDPTEDCKLIGLGFHCSCFLEGMTFYCSRLVDNSAARRTLTLKTQDHLFFELAAGTFEQAVLIAQETHLQWHRKRERSVSDAAFPPGAFASELACFCPRMHAWMRGAPYPMLLASGWRVHIVLALAAMSPSCVSYTTIGIFCKTTCRRRLHVLTRLVRLSLANWVCK